MIELIVFIIGLILCGYLAYKVITFEKQIKKLFEDKKDV